MADKQFFVEDGFINVAALTPEVRVADIAYNVSQIKHSIQEAVASDASLMVFPELSITGYTCEDLFLQDTLISEVEHAVADLCAFTREIEGVVCVGVPVRMRAKLYNCAAVISQGKLLGLVPKQNLATYNEFYEGRHFVAGMWDVVPVSFAGFSEVPFGAGQVFSCLDMERFTFGVELCEDVWVPEPPSGRLATSGAHIICNLSASNEMIGKAEYRRQLVKSQSARCVCAYVYASSGYGESTQDLVFSGHDMVCENGSLLAQAQPFSRKCALATIDLCLLAQERQRISSFTTTQQNIHITPFTCTLPNKVCARRTIEAHPFVPQSIQKCDERCEEILTIQAHGLAKRIAHTHAKSVVVGLSGGLDSTLALLVCIAATKLCDLELKDIVAVSMPGFGTTKRTHNNAADLAEALGVSFREISIDKAVRQHFEDISHDENVHDVVYENAQARERTKILMNIANQVSGFVIGTGDLSELALGWATYNGDHMSMYAVNASVPKTLVRHLVAYVAQTTEHQRLRDVLEDILATPVSPELLPASQDGTIAQITEDLVGPYELHDFFLYHVMRHGFSPKKIYRLACNAFATSYDESAILHWLQTFYRRFFSQQFKRSCLPDGPKVGSVTLSPRGDWRMPSDAQSTLWLKQLEEL